MLVPLAVLFVNPGFEEGLSGWEVRFGLSYGKPPWVKPLFSVKVGKGGNPGNCLQIRKVGRGSGIVLVGQRVKVPLKIPPLRFSVDLKTFCQGKERSGLVKLCVFDPREWDSLARRPEEAKRTPRPVWAEMIKPNLPPDFLTWRRLENTNPRALVEALASFRGRKVILAVWWECWHEGLDEWAMLDNLSVREEAVAISHDPLVVVYEGEPARFSAYVMAEGAPEVVVRFKREGSTPWREARLRPEGRIWAVEVDHGLVAGENLRYYLEARCRGEVVRTTVFEDVPVVERPLHPRLILTPAEIANVRERARKHRWARAILEGLLKKCERHLKERWEVPEESAGYYHDYFCPEHAVRLRFDPKKPREHICPVDGKAFRGEPYDSAWRYFVQRRTARATYELALGYALSGRKEFAEKAGRILLQYAEKYPLYPVWRDGRMMFQSLDEAVMAIDLVQAFDLIEPSGALSPEDKRRIEAQLLGAMAKFLMPRRGGVHNISCWRNAAIGLIGLALGSDPLTKFAMEGPTGWKGQIERGVLDDGLWFEGSIGYHFYALYPLWLLYRSAKNNGYPFPAPLVDRFKSMFEAPIYYAMPDLSLPALNDCWFGGSLLRYVWAYEVGYGEFQEPLLAWPLRLAYGNEFERRRSLEALLFGAEEIPPLKPPLLKSVNFPSSGLVILRLGEGRRQIYLLLDYGPHGGGHGHPDKLNIVLYGLGRLILPDLGTPGYGLKATHDWYRQTVAHNTVVVDRRSQSPAQGKLLRFHGDPEVAIADAECSTAYPGVYMRRVVALVDGLVLDLFICRSDDEHTYDWVAHPSGSVEPLVRLKPFAKRLGEHYGYQFIRNVKRASVEEGWALKFNFGNGRIVKFTGAGSPGLELFLGRCPGPTLRKEDELWALVLRKRGKEALFGLAIELAEGMPKVLKAEFVRKGALLVKCEDGRAYLLAVEPGTFETPWGALETSAPVTLVKFERGRAEWRALGGKARVKPK